MGTRRKQTEPFVQNVSGLIRRLASEFPAQKVPSFQECIYCPISKQDCPERLELTSYGETEAF